MTQDNIETRRQYHVYAGCSTIAVIAHLFVIDTVVDEMKSDDMIEVRQLMDEKIQIWK